MVHLVDGEERDGSEEREQWSWVVQPISLGCIQFHTVSVLCVPTAYPFHALSDLQSTEIG